jgi:hypothetical protein
MNPYLFGKSFIVDTVIHHFILFLKNNDFPILSQKISGQSPCAECNNNCQNLWCFISKMIHFPQNYQDLMFDLESLKCQQRETKFLDIISTNVSVIFRLVELNNRSDRGTISFCFNIVNLKTVNGNTVNKLTVNRLLSDKNISNLCDGISLKYELFY